MSPSERRRIWVRKMQPTLPFHQSYLHLPPRIPTDSGFQEPSLCSLSNTMSNRSSPMERKDNSQLDMLKRLLQPVEGEARFDHPLLHQSPHNSGAGTTRGQGFERKQTIPLRRSARQAARKRKRKLCKYYDSEPRTRALAARTVSSASMSQAKRQRRTSSAEARQTCVGDSSLSLRDAHKAALEHLSTVDKQMLVVRAVQLNHSGEARLLFRHVSAYMPFLIPVYKPVDSTEDHCDEDIDMTPADGTDNASRPQPGQSSTQELCYQSRNREEDEPLRRFVPEHNERGDTLDGYHVFRQLHPLHASLQRQAARWMQAALPAATQTSPRIVKATVAHP